MDNPKEPENSDIRFVIARRMLWNKDVRREPAQLGLVIRSLQLIVDNESADPMNRAEAESLIDKLYAACKEPKLS